ncbi:porin [Marinobacter metalliresistant]|uniref:Porin n=1 Tax=Marinobacter metalliresistant TaxID=2961995 RepID=A0ABZ2VZJ3_9GAMM
MKKTALASAIAASMAVAPALASAANVVPETGSEVSRLTARMDALPEIYGNVQMMYTNADQEGFGGGRSQLTDYGYSTLGVRHSHEILPGVEAFGKLELQRFSPTEGTEKSSNTSIQVDEAYFGIRGDFGEVWVGSDDSQYEVLIGDYGNWYYEVAQSNFYANWTTGEDDLIQYVSPSFGGLTLHGVVQIDGSTERGDGQNRYPYQLGVKYQRDRFALVLAMDSNDGAANNENTYGARVDYTVNSALSLNAFYSTQKGDEAVAAVGEGVRDNPVTSFESYGTVAGSTGLGENLFGVQGIYAIGASRFTLSYEMEKDDVDGAGDGKRESTNITAQALHSVSDNLYVYVEALRRNDKEGNTYDSDYNELNIGGAYLF